MEPTNNPCKSIVNTQPTILNTKPKNSQYKLSEDGKTQITLACKETTPIPIHSQSTNQLSPRAWKGWPPKKALNPDFHLTRQPTSLSSET